jgi:hypothetical protein
MGLSRKLPDIGRVRGQFVSIPISIAGVDTGGKLGADGIAQSRYDGSAVVGLGRKQCGRSNSKAATDDMRVCATVQSVLQKTKSSVENYFLSGQYTIYRESTNRDLPA